MNLTDSQQSAIDIRDSSLIISAGAGSGKTAVLTERILQRISDGDDDCTIADFLIVTFTNAAAKELSDRLRKKLSQKAEECPDNKKIAKNLALMPLAKISTINSFCYELVRSNFQKLNLSANVRMADEAEMSVIRQKIMNEVVDEAFDVKGDDGFFITAYEIFSGAKNDNGFVDTLLRLDVMLSNVPDREQYIKNVLDSYGETAECAEIFDSGIGKLIKTETEKFFEEKSLAFDRLVQKAAQDETLLSKYVPSLESEYEFTRNMLSKINNGYDEVKKLAEQYKPAPLSAVRGGCDAILKENVKNSKTRLCNEIKEFVSDFYSCDGDVLKKAANDTKNVLASLFELVECFREKLTNRKKHLGILEFSDAERLSLGLLTESIHPFCVTELAKELREKYKEIYIDEYQDVNPLQDAIFRAISRVDENDAEYSRFMVGDIKQSIYRFRGASPGIFMGYRDSFCDVNEEGRQKRIFMSHNFRCSENVINLCNYLFEKLMSDYFTSGDRLLYARQEQIKVDAKTQLLLVEADKEITEGQADADELEAAVIASKIKEMTDNPKYIGSDGKLYGYNDVAVLARSKSALKTFERVFTQKGIPVFSDVGESFYDKKEILLCLSILKSIDNPMQDIPLAGFMRSFAGKFTDDELCLIKYKYKNMKLYNSVKRYAESTDDGIDEKLSVKCRGFIEYLKSYRNYARGKSAGELVWSIYTDMGIMDVCSGEGFTSDGKSARRNLLKLYEMALNFDKTTFRGLGAFVDYINSSMEKDDVKSERVIGAQSVRLMTIHASKGLEFPICFVSDTARKFNKTDERQLLVFSGDNLMACSLCDSHAVTATESSTLSVRLSTPYKSLAAINIDREGMKEEVRILYVALTRARDYLFITGAVSRKPEKVIAEAQITAFLGDYGNASSFLTMILSMLVNEKAFLPVYIETATSSPEFMEDNLSQCLECSFVSTDKAMELYFDEDVQDDVSGINNCEDADEDFLLNLKSIADFRYGHDTKNPAKLTVSMLKKGLIEDEMSDLSDKSVSDGSQSAEICVNKYEPVYLPISTKTDVVSLENRVQKKVPDFVFHDTSKDGAEKGTAMHMFMQFARFEDCESEEGCRAEAKRLCDMEFITSKQLELLDYDALCSFFRDNLYKEVKNSTEIYREQRFNLYEAALQEENFNDDSCETLVQGVVDLFYRNSDGTYTVVDFKTDRVFGNNGENILKARHLPQLTYYRRAVEQMTGEKVKNVIIYSFSLNKSIEL